MRRHVQNGKGSFVLASLHPRFRFSATILLLSFLVGSIPSLAQSGDNKGPELVLQTGHSAQVSTVLFSPDGRLLASGSDDGTVKLWDVATGLELRTLTRHGDRLISAVAFSPDGRWLASSSLEDTVLWEVATGRELRTLEPDVAALAFGPNGQWLATLRAKTLKFWEPMTGRELRNLTLKGDAPAFQTAKFSSDGRWLVGIGDTNRDNVCVWDTATGVELRTVTTRPAPERGFLHTVHVVALGSDRRRLAAGNWDGTVKLWEVATGHEVSSFSTQTNNLSVGGVDALAFSPDGRWIASGAEATVLRDVDTGRVVHTFAGHTNVVSALAFSPNGQWLASSGSADGTIVVWDVATGVLLRKLTGEVDWGNGVAFSADGRWLATSEGDALKLWDISTGQGPISLISQTKAPDEEWWRTHEVTSFAFSPDGRWIASGSRDKTVKLWEVATGREWRTLTGHTEWVTAVAFSPDGRWIASGSVDKTVKLWEVATGLELRTLARHTRAVNAVAFSPDGHWLASGSRDNTIALWEVDTGRHFRTLNAGSTLGVHAVAFSPDGRWLASGSTDLSAANNLHLWDVATSTDPKLRVFAVESRTFSVNDEVRGLAFSLDGRMLASGGGETVKLWETATGLELRALTRHANGVNAVAFSPEGRWLASTSRDGSTRIWDPKTGDEQVAVLSLRHGHDWMAVAPDGLFDGTADAMQHVAWRSGGRTEAVTRLDSFFTDFYRPGLLADILTDEPPRSHVDIATLLQIPGLRTMLAQKQARLEVRAGKGIVCFEQLPDVAVQAPADSGPDLPTEINGYRVAPADPTCRYQKELPNDGNGSEQVAKLQSWRPEIFATPWDGKLSATTQSTLHVFSVGIGQYAAGSGFDPLPYAASSAKAVESFFAEQNGSTKKPFARVRIWPGLFDATATRESIRDRFAEMAKSMGEDDVAVVYLAGHGVVVQGQEMFYFVPVDGKDQDIRGTGLNTAMLAEALREMLAQRIVLIIDACQSGGAVEALSKIGEVKARVEQRRAKLESNTPPAHEHGVGVHIIAATMPLTYAVQLRSNQSALVATALESLGSGSGLETVRHLIARLKERLPELSEKTVGYRQVPLTSSVGFDFALSSN